MDYGDAEHAATITEGRDPAVRDVMQWLTYAHLPVSLQRFSEIFYQAAADLLERITTDSPELTTALNKLIEAKDSAVRAGIRHDTGRAGSVPRPQNVVAPPTLTSANQRTTVDPLRDVRCACGRMLRRLGAPNEKCTHGYLWGCPCGHVCGELPSDPQ